MELPKISEHKISRKDVANGVKLAVMTTAVVGGLAATRGRVESQGVQPQNTTSHLSARMGEAHTAFSTINNKTLLPFQIDDLNNDGNPDTVSVNFDGFVADECGKYGRWYTHMSIHSTDDAGNVRSVYEKDLYDNSKYDSIPGGFSIVDFNGDRRKDILIELYINPCTDPFKKNLYFLENKGNWQFDSHEIKLEEGFVGYNSGLATVPLRDGTVVAGQLTSNNSNSIDNYKRYLTIVDEQFNKTNYELTIDPTGYLFFPDENDVELTTSDANSDGDMDIIAHWYSDVADVSNNSSNASRIPLFSIWLGDGEGSFPQRQDYFAAEFEPYIGDYGNGYGQMINMQMGDFDGDCSTDAFFQYNYDDGTFRSRPIIQLEWRQDLQRFKAKSVYSHDSSDGISFSSMHFVDINDDGKSDLVGADWETMSYCLQDNAGGLGECDFQVISGIESGSHSYWLLRNKSDAWIDSDGDGRAELWFNFARKIRGTFDYEVGVKTVSQLPIKSVPDNVRICPNITSTPRPSAMPTAVPSSTPTNTSTGAEASLYFPAAFKNWLP